MGRAGKLLANYLRKRQQYTKLNCIRDPHSGKMEHHPSEIANAFMKYYKDLYNLISDNTMPQPFALNIDTFFNSLAQDNH